MLCNPGQNLVESNLDSPTLSPSLISGLWSGQLNKFTDTFTIKHFYQNNKEASQHCLYCYCYVVSILGINLIRTRIHFQELGLCSKYSVIHGDTVQPTVNLYNTSHCK